MIKYIYKITNQINNKIYIGQTTNYHRRWSEHKLQSSPSSIKLYNAFNKYGIENFTFEVIEQVENYNEREKYWISFYNSMNQGYNMTAGGEEPPVKCGEKHHLATHTQHEVNNIINILIKGEKTIKEIAQDFNYDATTIRRINTGALWYNENLSYPLKKEATKEYYLLRAKNIQQDLLYSTLTQKEIALKYQVGRTTITAINTGQNYHDSNFVYPIRSEENNKHSKAILQLELTTGEVIAEYLSSVEAAKQLNAKSPANIRACANGKIKSAYGYKWKYKI